MSLRFDLMSFLIVDDNRHLLNLITKILYGFGVEDVRATLDCVNAFTEIKVVCPDILICDQAMEPINGTEFTRLLRTSADSPNIYIPVIMVTGYGDLATACEARDAGVTEFLAKPVSAKSLYLRILEIINNPRPFIQTADYIGPDRRRVINADYAGPERRNIQPRSISIDDIEMV